MRYKAWLWEESNEVLFALAGRIQEDVSISLRRGLADGMDVIELSLTVPITNSLAFLFTVLGEWWAEGKVISRGASEHVSDVWKGMQMLPETDSTADTWIGMAFVLGGIALCVQSKNT